MATTATSFRPTPKPRTKVPASPEGKALVAIKISKPIPPPKPVGLKYEGKVKFRNPPLPSWSPPPSSSSSITTATTSVADKSSSKNIIDKALSSKGKMTSKIETETNEEKKAAAEKIVNSLKDGVEALNEVLNNFENDETETTNSNNSNNKRLTIIEVINVTSLLEKEKDVDEPNYVNIDAIYKKPDIEDKTMAYLMTGEVVTESEIVSCIEAVEEDITEVNNTSSEDDETTKFSELSLDIKDDSNTQVWIPQKLQTETVNNNGSLDPG